LAHRPRLSAYASRAHAEPSRRSTETGPLPGNFAAGRGFCLLRSKCWGKFRAKSLAPPPEGSDLLIGLTEKRRRGQGCPLARRTQPVGPSILIRGRPSPPLARPVPVARNRSLCVSSSLAQRLQQVHAHLKYVRLLRHFAIRCQLVDEARQNLG
jgi:hypothetical protein